MNTLTPALLLILSLFAAVPAATQPQPATSRTPALEAWENLGYGMFIHFGVSTFTGNECPHSDSKPEDYAPTALDVDQWIRVAHDAGMKYAVLTTKHCAGHCLWPSALTDLSVATSPNKTDVVGEFVAACRTYGVKPGFYYLLGWDAHHQPTRTPAQYEELCKGQLTELLTQYGPIQEVFLDIPFDTGPDMAGVLARLYAHIKSLQPECLVLPNQGFVDGSAVTSARPAWLRQDTGGDPVPFWPRDLMDGERTLPPVTAHNPHIDFGGKTYYLPMEVCDTLCGHWFWEPGDSPRPLRVLYRLYSSSRSRGANLLLDVGPDRTGRIPDVCVARLMELKAAIDSKVGVPTSLALGRPATASNTYHNDAAVGPDKAVDELFRSRWATDESQTAAWLEVDLGRGVTVDSGFVRDAYDRVHAFEIQVPDGQGWRTVYTGGTIGDSGVEFRFKPEPTTRIRLNITNSDGGPTIWEFEVYGQLVK